MHLGIGYSYRADTTATYELARDHPLDPSWKHTLSDVDGISLIGLETPLKLGYILVLTERVVADVGSPSAMTCTVTVWGSLPHGFSSLSDLT
jgi:hypothetical protein